MNVSLTLNTKKMFIYDGLIKQYMNVFEKYVYSTLYQYPNVLMIRRFKDRTSGVKGNAPADFLVITKNDVIFLEVKSRNGRLPVSDFRKSQITAARKLKNSPVKYYFLIHNSKNDMTYVLTYDNLMNILNEITDKNLKTIPWEVFDKYASYKALKRFALRYITNIGGDNDGN